MPVPDDGRPPPIQVGETLFDLAAAPAVVEAAAQEWRARALLAVAAQTTVDDAAGALVAEGSWQGATADRYQTHRAGVTAGLGELAGLLVATADALDGVASALRTGQDQLDAQWATVAGVPRSHPGTGVRFHPADEAQAALVRDAVSAAAEIRSWVDAEIVVREAALVTAQRDLAALGQAWQPQRLTVMNLNVGQGKGNQDALVDLFDWALPGSDDNASEGTEAAEMDEIADIIVAQGADVVTLQEVFEKDLDQPSVGDTEDLEQALESRTGDDWEIHFARADNKSQYDDAILDPDHEHFAPFGTAVAVRHGGEIEDSHALGGEDGYKLDEPGSEVQGPRHGSAGEHPFPGLVSDEMEDGEARVAAVTEVTIRDPER